MAAIAPNRRAVLLAMLGALYLRADERTAIHEQIARVASALSAGNAHEAMDVFDSSFKDYARLLENFTALTGAYTLVSEIDFVDEDIADGKADVTVHWVLTLGDMATHHSETRERDLNVRLEKKKGSWRIVNLAPVDFFNPQRRTASGSVSVPPGSGRR